MDSFLAPANLGSELVEFIKSKDPRWKAREDAMAAAKAEKKRLTELKKNEDKRLAGLARDRLRVEAAAEQAARDAEIDAAIARGEISGGESSSDSDSDSEERDFSCQACNKVFNSEGAKAQHFKSKKHEQRMFYLRKNGLLHLLDSDGEEGEDEEDSEEDSDEEDDDLSAEELDEEEDEEFDSADEDEAPTQHQSVRTPLYAKEARTGGSMGGLDSVPTPGAAWGEDTTREEELEAANLNFDSMWVRFRCGKMVVNKTTVPKSYYWHSETEQLTLIAPDEGVMDEVKVSQDEFDGAYSEATVQDTQLYKHKGAQSYKQKMKKAVAEAAAEQDSGEESEEEELPPPGLSGKEKKKWLKRQERLKRNAGGGGNFLLIFTVLRLFCDCIATVL